MDIFYNPKRKLTPEDAVEGPKKAYRDRLGTQYAFLFTKPCLIVPSMILKSKAMLQFSI